MTPDQRRAHLILHGQTLLDEWTEGHKLFAEGDKLRVEGDKLWADAVRKEFGPSCTMEWGGGTCTLSVGEVYLPVT